jgi:hypothetical protein
MLYKVSITGLAANTLYKIRVAGARKSIDLSSERYYVGSFSEAKDIVTLGEQ